jgi:hypothetical protein
MIQVTLTVPGRAFVRMAAFHPEITALRRDLAERLMPLKAV